MHWNFAIFWINSQPNWTNVWASKSIDLNKTSERVFVGNWANQRFVQNMSKILPHHFRLLIYFWSYTWSLKCGQLQDWKIQVVCMEDSIGCKIGNFQTESNVIMLHKHSNKSVSESLFIFHQRIQNLSANIV